MSEDDHSQTDPTLFEDSHIEHDSAFRFLGQGDRVGRYLVVAVLGTGGMGVVYAAYDPELDRRVALKLLNPAGGGSSRSSVGRARLLREAQAMARLTHPNVITVHDVGEHAGQVFVAMELVEGETLAAWIKRGGRPWTEVLRKYVEAGQGLAAAHTAGLVHRDFKPENVMVARDGRVVVMDFGLARSARGQEELAESAPRMGTAETSPAPLGERITRADALLGTPAYMAPEQFRREQSDARSDQFSFCVALYEGLYGERPYGGGTVSAAEAAIAGEAPGTPRGHAVPARVRSALLRGLEVDPERRFPSMNHLLTELEPPRRPRGWVGGVVAASVSLGAAAVVWALQVPTDACTDAASKIEEVWSAERRAHVGEAFARSELPYARSAWERTAARLDAYAREWADTRRGVCRAGVSHSVSDHMMDREMACLDAGLREMEALVGVLGSAEPTVIENAVQAAARLPPVSRCEDAEALLEDVDPPADVTTAEAVADVRGRLAEAEAHERAGTYARGLEVAHATVTDARAVGYRPVLAEALLRAGTLEDLAGRYEDAEASLREAFFVARGCRHSRVAGEAATGLLLVLGHRLARYDDALEWGAHAQAEVELAGQGTRLHARTLHGMGLVSFEQGDYAHAADLHRQAIEILRRVLGPDHPDLAQSFNDLGTAYAARADYVRARDYFTQARASWERSLGPDHPMTATALNNLGNVDYHLGEYPQAIEHYRQALAIREVALGRSHPSVAETLNNLGNAYEASGRISNALEAHERALEIKRSTRGEAHPSVAVTLNNLGNLLLSQGRAAEAVERYTQSLRIFEGALGPEHPNLAYPLTGLGRAWLEAGDARAAVEPLARAVELRTSHPAEPTHLAMSQFALARALRATGRDAARARRLAESARDAYTSAGEKSAEELERVRAWLDE